MGEDQDDLSGTFISVATMAIAFWLIGSWQLRWEYWSSDAVWYFAAAGMLFPALGQRFQIAAVKHVGPALTAAFGAFLPLFATLPAVFFLGETVTPVQAFGIALLISGLFLAAVGRGVSWKARAFYLIFLPLGAALVRAITQPLSKAGYNILLEPLFATIIVASVSTLVIGLMVVQAGSFRTIATFGKGHALFALNGLLIGAGILGLQLSLINGSVTLTSSIVSTTPIWTVVFGALFFKTEKVYWWHGVVAVLVSVGAIMVVVGHSPL
ncbi:MAG: DMT family transporter [Rhizobiaceae bacterium]|nr:DMT family transporter [Hyphomicrobiales bacterium]NRB31666.1 DMT family transporter [Rhizobiaceae bacterium]